MKLRIFFASTAGLILLSPAVFATPHECHSGVGKSAYERAFEDRLSKLGREWVFTYKKDCSDQVKFETIYASDFLEESGPAIRKCRNAGRNDATIGVINDISDQCVKEGEKHGAADGHQMALEYCEVNVTFSLLGNYVPTYEESCSAEFIQTAEDYCPDKVANEWDFMRTVQDYCKLL